MTKYIYVVYDNKGKEVHRSFSLSEIKSMFNKNYKIEKILL